MDRITIAAALLSFTLMLAPIAADAAPPAQEQEQASVAELKSAYLACDRLTSVMRSDDDTMCRCARIGGELLLRGFGGDFQALLAWWRAMREPSQELARADEHPTP